MTLIVRQKPSSQPAVSPGSLEDSSFPFTTNTEGSDTSYKKRLLLASYGEESEEWAQRSPEAFKPVLPAPHSQS